MKKEEFDSISRNIVDACFAVHKEMGPGLLESIYELCLIEELRNRGLKVQSQVPIPLIYKGIELSKDFRIDIW